MSKLRVYLFVICVLLAGTNSLQAQRTIEATRQFLVSGVVETPKTITVGDILAHDQVAMGDVVVKNHRGEEKKVAKNVKGVLLKDILNEFKLKIGKPKEVSELVVVLTATDGYKNIYSWNELTNNPLGDHVYVITEQDGKDIEHMESAIIVVSTTDINAGSRYFKGLKSIEIRKVDQ